MVEIHAEYVSKYDMQKKIYYEEQDKIKIYKNTLDNIMIMKYHIILKLKIN